MHEVSITFTGEVTYVGRSNDGSCPVTLKVDDGSQYGARCTVWTDVPVNKGDTLTITTTRMPYGKSREYEDKNGVTKIATDITFPDAQVNGGEYVAATADDEDVPF